MHIKLHITESPWWSLSPQSLLQHWPSPKSTISPFRFWCLLPSSMTIVNRGYVRTWPDLHPKLDPCFGSSQAQGKQPPCGWPRSGHPLISPLISLPIRCLLGIFLHSSPSLSTWDLVKGKTPLYPGGAHILARERP